MFYDYSAWQWLLVFYLYCVLGWCFESTVVSVQQRHFVNRGFLRGPMLPIYGFGATILLHVSLPLYDKPAALFLASMAAATVFEYVVGVIMEKLFKVKYWDYSEHRFQFQGRICLQSSLCWSFLGLILARVIHPPVEMVVAGLPFAALAIVDILLTILFAGDVVVSVRTALDLAKLLEELDELRAQGAELRQQLSETALVRLTNLSYRMDEARGEFAERMDDARGRLDDMREQAGDAYDQLAETAKVRGRSARRVVGEDGRCKRTVLRREGSDPRPAGRHPAPLFRARGRPETHAQKHAARQPDGAFRTVRRCAPTAQEGAGHA